MEIYNYKQDSKNFVRHNSLLKAINFLTVNRDGSCCVPRTYVRRAFDFFCQLDDGEPARKEAESIDTTYISSWETLHDSVVGHKRPADLSVCYLAGPQPENDFNELISLGVLPQNIWAFENDKATYLKAINSYNASIFPQPKIVKMPIEQFFKHSPKKFDVVYIDACGNIISSQHALRYVSTLFFYQRLNSPGVVITNFSKPDISKEHVLKEFASVIALYFVFKEFTNGKIVQKNNKVFIENYEPVYYRVIENFEDYYGTFITSLISDLASIIIPLQRFGDIAQYSNLFTRNELLLDNQSFDIESIDSIKNNSVCKWILLLDWLSRHAEVESPISFNPDTVLADFVPLDGDRRKLIKGILYFIGLKNGTLGKDSSVLSIKAFFDAPNNIYQFLDRTGSSLLFDVVINQLSYPLHSNTGQSCSFQYCAKQTQMFTDVILLDECRYLYEWLPTIHQIEHAMRNKGWQYVFRFALDSLVKQRLNYNNEFFFQGSVVAKDEIGFEAKKRVIRQKIGE